MINLISIWLYSPNSSFLAKLEDLEINSAANMTTFNQAGTIDKLGMRTNSVTLEAGKVYHFSYKSNINFTQFFSAINSSFTTDNYTLLNSDYNNLIGNIFFSVDETKAYSFGPNPKDSAVNNNIPSTGYVTALNDFNMSFYLLNVSLTVEKEEYTASYNANGGSTAAPPTATYEEGSIFSLPSYSGTKEGFIFGGWNDGASTYPVGAQYTMPSNNVTFTAVWTNTPMYSASYNANGGDTAPPPTTEHEAGDSFILPPYTGTRLNFKFDGWNDGGTTYQVGSNYTMPSYDVYFTAVWTPDSPSTGDIVVSTAGQVFKLFRTTNDNPKVQPIEIVSVGSLYKIPEIGNSSERFFYVNPLAGYPYEIVGIRYRGTLEADGRILHQSNFYRSDTGWSEVWYQTVSAFTMEEIGEKGGLYAAFAQSDLYEYSDEVALTAVKWLNDGKFSSVFSGIRLKFSDYIPPTDGDDSTTGGGDGTEDGNSDNIPLPGLPTLNITGSGFISLYEMNNSQLRDLANYMWSTNFFDNIVKLFANPMDIIISLAYAPVDIISATKEIQLGNLINTGVYGGKIAGQYTVVDCGELKIEEFWASYLDYSPYTQVSLFLPFIGNVELDIDDVMGHTLKVRYVIDLVTMTALCSILVKADTFESVLYTYNTNIGSKIPITSADYSQVYKAILDVAGSTVGGAMTGGAGMAVSQGVNSAISNIGVKPQYAKSNQIGGASGIMGVLTPYVIITRPQQQRPANFNSFDGYMLQVTELLGNMQGFTKVMQVQLQDIPCTKTEYDLIETLLKEGIII